MPSFSKLLDFDLSGEPRLVPAGLQLLRDLPAGISVLVLLGIGRSGKSFLAERLGQHVGLPVGTFRSAGTQAPVTVGIDIAVARLNTGFWTVILDCEGGNNAQAAIRQFVHVLGTMVAGQVVFVSSGQAGEPELQALGHALAARQLIRGSGEAGVDGLTVPALFFTVNKKDPSLEEQDLEELLREQHDQPRNALRAAIKTGFAPRRLFSIPFLQMPNFVVKWQELRDAVLAGMRPLTVSGVQVAGPQLEQIFQTAFTQMRQNQVVEFPDVLRVVLYDVFLHPKAAGLSQDFENGLPALHDFVSDIEHHDARRQKLEEFGQQTAHIRHDAFKSEARRWLVRQMDRAWAELVDLNRAIGKQVSDTTTESKEEHERSYLKTRSYYENGKDWCHCGTRVKYCGNPHTCHVYVSYTRSRMVHKDGSITHSEWVKTGSRESF